MARGPSALPLSSTQCDQDCHGSLDDSENVEGLRWEVTPIGCCCSLGDLQPGNNGGSNRVSARKVTGSGHCSYQGMSFAELSLAGENNCVELVTP